MLASLSICCAPYYTAFRLCLSWPTCTWCLTVCTGLLVRHATYIAEELASTGVVEVLSEALKVGLRLLWSVPGRELSRNMATG